MAYAVTFVLMAIVLSPLLFLTRRPDPRTVARLAEIERKLQLVMDHLGVVDTHPAPPGVRQHLQQGNRIAAIKAYREATGVDLAEAKRAVDEMAGRGGAGR